MFLNISIKKKKKILLLALIFCCCIVSGGYFYTMYKTAINANVRFSKQASWNIKFTEITTKNEIGSAVNYKAPVLYNYEAIFYIEFKEPGDSITYDIKIKNFGTLNAMLNNINFYSNILDQVDFSYEKVNTGMILTPEQEITVRVKLTYNPKTDSIPIDDGKITLSLDWIQAS
ncbi:MAG: hypothetical protein PUD59_02125 [bacterium]|nr:hypothetical protein [bacterium]